MQHGAPMVILLDIDGTLIGDITPQVVVYDLCNRVKIHGAKDASCIKPQLQQRDFQEKLRDGIIRPHAKAFLVEMQRHGVEVFIYTASEKKWAEFLIKNIEQSIEYKFNRPIFTRNDCVQEHAGKCIKHVRSVLPAIVRSINKKYRSKFKALDFQGKVMAIDNNNVYGDQDQNSLVVCSTYKYMYPENVAAMFTKRSYELYSGYVHTCIATYINNYKPHNSFLRFEKQFYQSYYIEALQEVISKKQDFLRDVVFKIIMYCIKHKNMTTFSKSNVKYINWKLQQHNASGTGSSSTTPNVLANQGHNVI